MKPLSDPLERDIEKRVCEYARSKGILCYKFTSPSRCSLPDRLLITPSGLVFFMELKRKGQVPTKAQYVEIDRIRKQKVLVFVCDSVEAGRKIVGEMLCL